MGESSGAQLRRSDLCHRRALANVGWVVAGVARCGDDRMAADDKKRASPSYHLRKGHSRSGEPSDRRKETNDFIYGPLHTALRKQLHAGLKAAGNLTGFTFADLLDHPAVRYPDPRRAADWCCIVATG